MNWVVTSPEQKASRSLMAEWLGLIARPELLRAYKELNHLRFPKALHVGEALISKGWAVTSKGELIYYFAAPIDALAAYRASGGLVGKAE
jgi:hypothetical protein